MLVTAQSESRQIGDIVYYRRSDYGRARKATIKSVVYRPSTGEYIYGVEALNGACFKLEEKDILYV